MNIDPQYVDKQKDLEAIFEIAYTQGLPLSGEHGAIALAQRMSRASFYLIPAEVRDTVREDVEQRIDAEHAEEKRVLAALRLSQAQEIERRSLKFMQVLLDRLEARIADEDIADKNLAELGKLYLDVTRNNVTPEYATELPDDEQEIPRFPVMPPIARLPLLASDDPITEFTATARTASGVQVTVSTPDRLDAVEGQIIDQAD
jgi:hypothetical protein